jgi:cytochrome c peroxidase
MSGGRKPVQQGVRIKLPDGITWETLVMMSPKDIRAQDRFPEGFLPLPHADTDASPANPAATH